MEGEVILVGGVEVEGSWRVEEGYQEVVVGMEARKKMHWAEEVVVAQQEYVKSLQIFLKGEK